MCFGKRPEQEIDIFFPVYWDASAFDGDYHAMIFGCQIDLDHVGEIDENYRTVRERQADEHLLRPALGRFGFCQRYFDRIGQLP